MAGYRKQRRGRKEKNDFNPDNWIPKTEIGRKVKAGEITSLEEIFEIGKTILEGEIVDTLLPGLESEVIEIRNTQ